MAKIAGTDDDLRADLNEPLVDARIRITPEVIEKWLREGKKKR